MELVFSKLKKILSFIIFLFAFFTDSTFAGVLISSGSEVLYYTNDGIVAKNIWVWIDDNNDNIAECYRFDEIGTLAKNYIHYDGKKTNEKGQLLDNGNVVKKILSNGKIITKEDENYGPKIEKENNYLYGNVLIPDSMGASLKQKITNSWNVGSETLANDEGIDGQIINNTKKEHIELEDIIPETGIIYSKDPDDVIINKEGNIVPGKYAANFITSSYRFDKDIDYAYIFNGEKWEHCMALKGNNSKVKFTLNKYNYMYFEISNENHTNETYRQPLDAILTIYVDDKIYETIDDCFDTSPQIVEIDLDDAKTVELKLNIKKGNLSERVFLNNARFRKIKNEN